MRSYKILLYILIAFASLVSTKAYSQKLGYKGIEIGKKISDVTSLVLAIFRSKEDPNNYIVKGEGLKFCDLPLYLVSLETDSTKTIVAVTVLTQNMELRDYDALEARFLQTVDCVINTVGKADLIDARDVNLLAGWNFDDQSTQLTILSKNMSIFEENKSRAFQIKWKSKKVPSMW